MWMQTGNGDMTRQQDYTLICAYAIVFYNIIVASNVQMEMFIIT